MAGSGQPVRLRRGPGHPPVVRRDAAPLGAHPGAAPRAVSDRSRHGPRRRGGCRPVRVDRRSGELDGAGRAANARLGSTPAARRRGGMCAHTVLVHPAEPDRLHVAISAVGVFRSFDRGRTWEPANHGLHSVGLPDEDAEVGHYGSPHRPTPGPPGDLVLQKHWDVMRSDDGGTSWREISGDLPSDVGLSRSSSTPTSPRRSTWCPSRVYVVPITSDSGHYPPRES